LVEELNDPTKSRWTPRTTEWFEIVNAYGSYLNLVLTGEMPIKDGLDKAAEELRAIMEEAGYYE